MTFIEWVKAEPEGPTLATANQRIGTTAKVRDLLTRIEAMLIELAGKGNAYAAEN
jgi:hypothetical protein